MKDIEIVIFNDKSWVRLTEYQKNEEQLSKRICELQSDLSKAKSKIEKMKNWCNCKNYQECLIELAAQGKGMKPSECCVNCKKWELKE